MTHFGDSEDVDAQLDALGRRLDAWAERAREQEQDEFIAAMEAEIKGGTEPAWLESFALAAMPDQQYAGLRRYWRKRAERGRSPGAARVS